jgi:CBS domain-containing protein
MQALSMPSSVRTRCLPILERSVVTGGAVITTAHLVFCSAREETVPLGTCDACSHLIAPPHQARPGGVVTCAPPTRRLNGLDFSKTGRFDVAEVAAHTVVAEVLARCAVFVTPEASLDSAIDLMQRGAECVPIVDAEGKLTGVLRPHDVLGAPGQPPRGDLPPSPRRHDVVRESMPISLAFAVLADSGHSALPVVNESGIVVGILSALDLTRWVARRMGYVVG